MIEKTKCKINCEICDARMLKEESYAGYESLMINAETVLVTEETKEILNRLGAVINAEELFVIDNNEPLTPVSVNGDYTISKSSAAKKNTTLSVNGNLTIEPDTAEVLKNFLEITVNGSVSYPRALQGALPKLTVNGDVQDYPEDAIVLKPRVTIDRLFLLRAKENALYYVKKAVFVTDPAVDVKALAEKNVRFLTEEAVLPEETLEDSVRLFDESVEIRVIPRGYMAVTENTELTEDLLRKFGKKLYVYGNLKVTDESIALLRGFSGDDEIIVEGKIKTVKRLSEGLSGLPLRYRELVIEKGTVISGQAFAAVDHKAIELSPDGIEFSGVGAVRVKKDLTPEEITEYLSFSGVGAVTCDEAQESAVAAVSSGVGHIGNAKDLLPDGGGIGGLLKKGIEEVKDSKIINAETYVM